MPELPEVETIRRGLDQFILRKCVKTVQVFCDKSFIGPKELIFGQEIIAIRRFGKALIFDFANGVSADIRRTASSRSCQISRLAYYSLSRTELYILTTRESLGFVRF